MFCPCPVLTALQAAWQGKELIHCLLRVRQHRSTGGTSTSDSLSLDLFFNRVLWWWNHSPNTLEFMRLCSLGNNPTVLISMMSPVLSRIPENYPTSDSNSLTLWQTSFLETIQMWLIHTTSSKCFLLRLAWQPRALGMMKITSDHSQTWGLFCGVTA